MNKPRLRYPEAAEFLRDELGIAISEFTLRTYVSRRRIPFIKIGKSVWFDRELLTAWVLAHYVEAVEPRVGAVH